MTDQERGDLELLTEQGLVEVKGAERIGMPTFHRLSDAALPVIRQLQEGGRIKFQ
jgi:hypothetical protein